MFIHYSRDCEEAGFAASRANDLDTDRHAVFILARRYGERRKPCDAG
jgi:hypothetical protein